MPWYNFNFEQQFNLILSKELLKVKSEVILSPLKRAVSKVLQGISRQFLGHVH